MATTQADVNTLTTDSGLFWIGGANSLSWLSFIYKGLISNTSGVFRFFLDGMDCYTDATFATADGTKNNYYCDFALPQLWKSILITAAVTSWFGMIFTVDSWQYLYKITVEANEGGYQDVLDNQASLNESLGSDFKAPG